MTEHHYRATLEAAQRELAEAIRNRDLWNTRILQLQQTIRNLSVLTAQETVGDQIRVAVELNDAIMLALRNTAQPLTPVEIRNGLVAMGFQMGRRMHFSNPMSALHNALGRLEKKGLVRKLNNGTFIASY
jgi:hypothetical protein